MLSGEEKAWPPLYPCSHDPVLNCCCCFQPNASQSPCCFTGGREGVRKTDNSLQQVCGQAHMLLRSGILSFRLAKPKIVSVLADLLGLGCAFQKSILKAFKLKDITQLKVFDRIEYFQKYLSERQRNCFFKDKKMEITANIICFYSKLTCSSENPFHPVCF